MATRVNNKYNYLILVRHGQSIYNLENKFTGWKNVSLTQKGIDEAGNAAKLLKTMEAISGASIETNINTLEEWDKMSSMEKKVRENKSKDKLLSSEAHYIIKTINELPDVVKDINNRLNNGEKP